MALTKCKECNGAVSTLASACPHCGAPVSQARTPQQPSPPVPQGGRKGLGALSGTQPSSVDHEDLVRLFVGKNYEYYARKWTRMEQREGLARKIMKKEYSWNWAAFFVAFNWTAYRKMYGYSSLIVYLFVIHLFVATLTSYGDAFNIFYLLAAGSYAQSGNYWYKLHVEEKLKEITATGASNEAIRIRLVKEGGTNLRAAVAFSLVMIILAMLIVALGR